VRVWFEISPCEGRDGTGTGNFSESYAKYVEGARDSEDDGCAWKFEICRASPSIQMGAFGFR